MSRVKKPPDNSAHGKIKRAVNHIRATIVLIGGLPQAYWTDEILADNIQHTTSNLRSIEKFIKSLLDKNPTTS